jgi:hypothetical protein
LGVWLTPEEVALYLDVPYPEASGRLDDATAAAIALIEGRRTDLDYTDATTVPKNVIEGTKWMAAQFFQTRNAPSGYVGYGDETQLYDALGARRAEILRMVGWRRPGVF